MPLNTAFFPCLLINLSIDILVVCLIDNNALRGKQNLNYKIYWEKKLMNRIDYSSSVMNSPQNFTSLLSKLKTLFNILI